MTRFLSNQVEIYRQTMSPERSIYDLCKVVFANSQIMLREHFRCVTPIIEYSKREFYNHELKPLRLPTRSERLDPPLIDVFLERAGWSFWRCLASTFVLSRENVIEDLIKTLTEKGIEPIGSDGILNNIHTEHRRIKVYEDVSLPINLSEEDLMVSNG